MFFIPWNKPSFGNRQQSNARAGQEKIHVFLVMSSLNLMRSSKNREKNPEWSKSGIINISLL